MHSATCEVTDASKGGSLGGSLAQEWCYVEGRVGDDVDQEEEKRELEKARQRRYGSIMCGSCRI